jgi:hypothetical protein
MKSADRITVKELSGQNTLLNTLPFIGDLVGNASMKDVVFAVVIPVFTTMFVFEGLPSQFSSYGIYAILIVAAVGFGVVAAVPNYTSLSSLIKQFKIYKTRASENRISESEEDEELEHRSWESTESTIEKTFVEKIYGDEGMIERDDETIVGAMRVRGMNLDTATARTQSDATQSWKNFLNTGLDFPIQIYLSTRRFDPDNYLDKFENRLNDEEIENNYIMDMYLNHYIERTPVFLSQQYYREYYIIVPVNEWDIRRKSREEGALDLSVIPGIGELLAELFGSSDVGRLTESQVKKRQIDEARTRLQTIKKNGIGSLDGAEAEIITDANEYAALIKEFWEGRDMSFKENSNMVRNNPVVMGESDTESVKKEQQKIDVNEFVGQEDNEGDTK